MSRKLIDLTGQVFGAWTVLRRAEDTPPSTTRWVCRCACGTLSPIRSQALRRGSTRRCNACRMFAVKTVKAADRRCRWCKRFGVPRSGGSKRLGLFVAKGECETCRRQARRNGRGATGRPLVRGVRRVTT